MPIWLRVRELRQAKGLSIRQLAGLADISPTTLVDIEMRRRLCGLDVLEKLAEALEVNAALLIVHEAK